MLGGLRLPDGGKHETAAALLHGREGTPSGRTHSGSQVCQDKLPQTGGLASAHVQSLTALEAQGPSLGGQCHAPGEAVPVSTPCRLQPSLARGLPPPALRSPLQTSVAELLPPLAVEATKEIQGKHPLLEGHVPRFRGEDADVSGDTVQPSAADCAPFW